jgi:helicase
MRLSLARWISDADRLRHLDALDAAPPSLAEDAIRARVDDLYIALVGELFTLIRTGEMAPSDCARLANAFIDMADRHSDRDNMHQGISPTDARLFGAAAFYFGGFPASAYLSIRSSLLLEESEVGLACIDLLGKRTNPRSGVVSRIREALLEGNMRAIRDVAIEATEASGVALRAGPTEWILARLFEQLARRFESTNLRAVLPRGASEQWTPLVASFMNRPAAAWEFFPSQIDAITGGLLTGTDTYSLQMPTGAGKTALCETLLYWHATTTPASAAVMLVPYRSLASELRGTLVKRLNEMKVVAGCIYGGTVPTSDEVRDLDKLQTLVATPEALSGVLSAYPGFFQRISLVICDEGHLLDSGSRGVSLELLLARLRARQEARPKCVFVSAIVPNIEEINTWLGGSATSVIRSEYRASIAEYGVLRSSGKGARSSTALEMHPQEAPPDRFQIESFLPAATFQVTNRVTGRANNYPHISIKTKAIAAARKVLPLGAVAVFATNKRGDQGVVGLAEELIAQLRAGVDLPDPATFAEREVVSPVVDYLLREFGSEWIGARALAGGAILHHGDVPQEAREAMEDLLRRGHVRMVLCTSTLAEGVNLPIRTLVLYSVRRRGLTGKSTALLTRDIKNLVGRAGRAGATTKGLVICANDEQWPLVEQVARQALGENVQGALRRLVTRLGKALAVRSVTLSNEFLEQTVALHELVDGIDSTLIDLAAEEVGEGRLVEIAERVASQTFAYSQGDAIVSDLLRQVFGLRARRIAAIKLSGQLDWLRATGARARSIGPVETGLVKAMQDWSSVVESLDPIFLNAILDWAWVQPEILQSVRSCFGLGANSPVEQFKPQIGNLVRSWIAGNSFAEMARVSNWPIDEVLRIHAHVISYGMQTVIEQGIALLGKVLELQGQLLPDAVIKFPEHLRYGIPSRPGCLLAAVGVRHRRAAVLLGDEVRRERPELLDMTAIPLVAWNVIERDQAWWTERLGVFVHARTVEDLGPEGLRR